MSNGQPVLPRYGHASLVDVLPSVGAHLGVPGCRDDVVGLPAGERWVVVLVDGLGWHLLLRLARHAPYLASLAEDPITVGVPSTTATSITSLGTGLVPGQHGIVGYRFYAPEAGAVFSPLAWDCDVPAEVLQPHATVFERVAACGLVSSSVTPERFRETGLTAAALRGAVMSGLDDEDDYARRTALTVAAAERGPGLTYVYERKLDHSGHSLGVAHDLFAARLARIDRWCERLRESLPDDVRLLVTGDHGMLDVPPERRIAVEDHPRLLEGVRHVAGEGRFRHVYCADADAAAVAERWAEDLGERAWVRTREQAVAEGWFGPLADAVESRFGEVVVAMREDWAVMTRARPGEWNLVGMHGSLTADEMLVPLLVD